MKIAFIILTFVNLQKHTNHLINFIKLKSLKKLINMWIKITLFAVLVQPEIAQFNGFKTLGGYKSTYPHSKCLEVRTILNNDQKICLSRLQIHQSDIEGVNFNPKSFCKRNSLCHF